MVFFGRKWMKLLNEQNYAYVRGSILKNMEMPRVCGVCVFRINEGKEVVVKYHLSLFTLRV